MSYARKGQKDSDVYVIACACGGYECLGCNISDNQFFVAYKPDNMIWHLHRHLEAGDKVPDRTFNRLRDEM